MVRKLGWDEYKQGDGVNNDYLGAVRKGLLEELIFQLRPEECKVAGWVDGIANAGAYAGKNLAVQET